MQDNFTITLPSTVSDDEMEALQTALREEESVEDTGSMAARGIDPGNITLWVQVASSVLGVVGTAVPIIQKVVRMIRGKGITGATIKLPSGAEISVDNASAAEIEKLLQAVGQK